MSNDSINDLSKPGNLAGLGGHPIDSRDLFGNSTQVDILHHGETYHLRITRQGKLILTK